MMKPSDTNIASQEFLEAEYEGQPGRLFDRRKFYEASLAEGEPWSKWLFAHLDVQPGMNILDLGCGEGVIWHEAKNRGMLPADISVTLVDQSSAMIELCSRKFESDHRFSFNEADILRFLDNSVSKYDLILASHVIYHINEPERLLALTSAKISNSGSLTITSVGAQHLGQIRRSLNDYCNAINRPMVEIIPSTFTNTLELETLFEECFETTQCSEYLSKLAVLDKWQLASFLRASTSPSELSSSDIEDFVSTITSWPFEVGTQNLLVKGSKT